MGAVRTTFAMVAALIVRRRMLLARGLDDPYAVKSSFVFPSGAFRQGSTTPGINTVRGFNSLPVARVIDRYLQPNSQVI